MSTTTASSAGGAPVENTSAATDAGVEQADTGVSMGEDVHRFDQAMSQDEGGSEGGGPGEDGGTMPVYDSWDDVLGDAWKDHITQNGDPAPAQPPPVDIGPDALTFDLPSSEASVATPGDLGTSTPPTVDLDQLLQNPDFLDSFPVAGKPDDWFKERFGNPGDSGTATPTPMPGPTPTPTPTPTEPPKPPVDSDATIPEAAIDVNDPQHSFRDGPLSAYDVPDVNKDGACDAKDVKALVASRQNEVNERIATWQPEQQEQYQRVAQTIQSDPRATQALQDMVLDGRLESKETNREGQTLLQTLDGLATQDMAKGLDRTSYLGDVVQEIENPTLIYQGNAGTCGPTSATQVLATEQPAEYARLAAGLATPEGEVKMANGDTLHRETEVIGETGKDRSQSTALLSTSLMEYSSSWFPYDVSKDFNGWGGKLGYAGEMNWDHNHLLEAVTGKDYSWESTGFLGTDSGDLMNKVEESTAKGEIVPTLVNWGSGGHYVNVVDVDEDTVTFVNPHGKEQSVPREVFERNLTSAYFEQPSSVMREPTPMPGPRPEPVR